MRESKVLRKTAETDIQLELKLDGRGVYNIDTGCGFLDHMLTLFAAHGNFDLKIKCTGDKEVDYHHSVEDIGICLGLAFKECLGDKKGIVRYGQCLMPMDEALVMVALDFSGRAYLGYDVELRASRLGDDGEQTRAKVGVFDTELIEEFFSAFTRSAKLTLHVKKISGRNTHHIIEAVFKAFGKAVRDAVGIDLEYAEEIPSTKGVL